MSELLVQINATSVPRTTLVDLVIEEFDQWSNPRQWALSPTTTCWCQADLLEELAA